jgi:hypothetical protein
MDKVEGGIPTPDARPLRRGEARGGILLSALPGDCEIIVVLDVGLKVPRAFRLPETVYNGKSAFPAMEKLGPLVGGRVKIYSLEDRCYVAPGGVR